MRSAAALISKQLPNIPLLGYAVGSFGAGVYSIVPSILLLYFMTQVLLVPVALAPLAVLVPKLVIVVVEPLIGAWSDRTRSAWGRRRPFLLAGAILSAITFLALFSTPRLGGVWPTLAGVACAYLAASLGFSFFAVPYVSMPTEIASDAGDRTRIVAWRMTFVFAGVLFGAALPPILVEQFGGGAAGYRGMALVVAGLSFISMMITFFTTAPLPGRPPDQGRRGLGLGVASILRFPPFRAALFGYAAIMTGFGALSSAAPYYVAFALGRPPTALSTVFAVQILAALAAMFVWGWLAPIMRFARALGLATMIALAGVTILYFAGAEAPFFMVLVGTGLIGVGSAGVQVAGFALLADVTDRASVAIGVRREGLMTGLWTSAEKVALAMGPVVSGAVLGLGGFLSGLPRADQPPEALDAARHSMTLAPGLIFVFATLYILLSRRHLDQRTEPT